MTGAEPSRPSRSGSDSDGRDVSDIPDAIAIIGMAGRFPGAGNIEEFWHNLRDGVESISPVSMAEMLDAGVDATAVHDPRRVAAASTLAGIEYFDEGFFDISPRQAALTDPQHRIFLECAWEALENAGWVPATSGHAVGVFAGSSISTYLIFHVYPSIGSANRSSDLQVLIGNDKDYLATLVAYKLGLTGPAISVQTACSTSLVAVHLACQSLLNRECDLALAGGVTVRLPARAGYLYEIGGILSPDGHCRPFDADAQGTIFGSGVGVVVLKRLADALVNGDVIDAIIRGSAVNNDGAVKAGYTAPSEDGQAMVVAEALAMAAVEPDTIGYVEMHGTGTPLGDPIEVAALARAFRSRGCHPAPRACAIGAVKSNVGHLESAAGVAGLVKTVLALTHRQIPPSLHFARPNPAIDFEQTPFYVTTRPLSWEARRAPRRAGVSSFGIGGTNAHVVLEEAPAPPAPAAPSHRPGCDGDRPYLLPLSARAPAALEALAQRYRDLLADGAADDGPGPHLADVCWSAGVRRRHHEHRWAAVGRTRGELVARLSDVGRDATAPSRPSGHRRTVVFLFPGHGSQWIGMGRQLLEREPAFRTAVQLCDDVMRSYASWSPLLELARDEVPHWWENTGTVQLALFAVQAGLAAWWRSLGIEPDAVVGLSVGEVAAAYVAGALDLAAAVRVLCHRNRLIEPVLGQGRMLAVGLTADEARQALAGHEERVSLAIMSSPKSAVLSGDPAALESIAAALRNRKQFHRWVNVDFASHSPQMDPLLEPLRHALNDLRSCDARVPIISTVTGEPIKGTMLDAGYWARNLREPVRFADATRWLGDHDYDVFLEISPHPILLPAVEDSLYHLGPPATVVASLRRDSDEQLSLLQGVAALYRAGHDIEWDRLYPGDRRFVRLPSYPWQRHRHWVDPPRDVRPNGAAMATVHPLLGRRLRSALPHLQFESDLGLLTVPYLDDHRVCGRAVFPAAGYLEMLWQAASTGLRGPAVVSNVVLHDLLIFSDPASHVVQTVFEPDAGAGVGRLAIFSWQPDRAGWRMPACKWLQRRWPATRPGHPRPATGTPEETSSCRSR